jgi:hypothetical protein
MLGPKRNIGLALCLLVAPGKSSLNIKREETKHRE